MDLLLMIFFSVRLSKLAKEKGESTFGWVFRYISLCLGFEFFLMFCFSSYFEKADLYKKLEAKQIISFQDLLPLLIFAVASCLLIFLIYTLLKKSLDSIKNNRLDDFDDNDKPVIKPEKDLSYFR